MDLEPLDRKKGMGSWEQLAPWAVESLGYPKAPPQVRLLYLALLHWREGESLQACS